VAGGTRRIQQDLRALRLFGRWPALAADQEELRIVQRMSRGLKHFQGNPRRLEP
jgi:hypothetical protein